MQLYLDAVLQPLPSWTAEMLAKGVEAETGQYVPARLADFAVRYASELSRNRGRWLTEIQPEPETLLIRVAVVNCTSKPTATVSGNLKQPVTESLKSARDLHRQAAADLRSGYARLAVEGVESIQAFWQELCTALDALDAMGELPSVVKPNALEAILGRLEASFPRETEEASKAIESLGELAEQWSAAIGAKAAHN